MAIYKITNVASNKCLNVHGNNVTTISAGQNLTIWSDSGTNEQRWDVNTLSNNALIRCVINYRYTPYVSSGNNCDLRLIAGNETNSWMNIIKSGNYYKIQNKSTSLYLTVAGTSNGSNVYWAEAGSTNANYQLWKFDRIAPYEAIPGEDYTYPTTARVIKKAYSASHKGIDIVASTGTPVYAFASGFVAYRQSANSGGSTEMNKMGNCIVINHHNPKTTIELGSYARSFYMHLSSIPALEVGTFVEKGQLIGYTGNSGDAESPMLHFALAVGFETSMKPGNTGWVALSSLNLIDPERYLTGYFKFRWPTESTVTEEMFNANSHLGIDILPLEDDEPGDEVYAIADGTVERYFPWVEADGIIGNASMGICLYIKHTKQQSGTENYMRSIYMHLDEALVTSGNVTKGQLIGYMGHTGECSSNTPGKNGTHLHFAVKSNDTEFGSGAYELGDFENPMNYRYDYE